MTDIPTEVPASLTIAHNSEGDAFEQFDDAFKQAAAVRHQLEDEEARGTWKIQVMEKPGDDDNPLGMWRDVAPPILEPYRFQSKRHAQHMVELLYPELCREIRLGETPRVRIKGIGVPNERITPTASEGPADPAGS